MQHSNQITVERHQSISIRGGWAMVCPECGNHVASGSDDVKKPIQATCFGTEKPVLLAPLKKVTK